MRLINVATEKLEEHYDPPPYVILSHRWEDNEVSLGEYERSDVRTSQGFRKIASFLNEVRKRQPEINYVWVDTCCIDKTSSAELSEAINSMYNWYQYSRHCFVYLSDVDNMEDLERSRWFTRGWTLQELIAPFKVDFFNRNWSFLGTKDEMCERLSQITRVTNDVLAGRKGVFSCSVAQRLSWAAKRTTTRPEDRAYSLMGLFGVNMPMLYGEGEKAFYRLQQEIIRESDDQSIFAWTRRTFVDYRFASKIVLPVYTKCSLISTSIDNFSDCGQVRTCPSLIRKLPYFLTNIGLSVTLFLLPWTMHVYIGLLSCERLIGESPKRIGIYLRRLEEEDDQFARIRMLDGDIFFLSEEECWTLFRQVPQVPRDGLLVRVRQQILTNLHPVWFYGFELKPPSTTTNGEIPLRSLTIYRRDSEHAATEPGLLKLPDGQGGTVATIVFHNLLPFGKVVYVRLGFDFDFRPVMLVTLETTLELDSAGFVRPENEQFRAERGCRLHNWLKEIVENDGKYFRGRRSTLAMMHLGKQDYDEVQPRGIQVMVFKEKSRRYSQPIPAHWSVSIQLDVNALTNLSAAKPIEIS